MVYEAGKPGLFDADHHGPAGIAKAHELMLRFHGPDDADVPEKAVSFLHPCRPMVAPETFEACRAVGRIAGACPERESAAEALIEHLADFITEERAYRRWYGLLDYGDVQVAYYSDLDRWGYDDGGGTSTGGPYILTGTIGQPDASSSQGDAFIVMGGFWPGGPVCIVNLEHFANFAQYWLTIGTNLHADLYDDGSNIVNLDDLDVFLDY